MQVTTSTYQQKVQEVHQEIDKAFKQLKRVKQSEWKEREKIKKRIKHLVTELTDLKYRASF